MRTPALVVAAALLAAALPAAAQLAISVSKSPDTKTRFIWTGSDLKQNVDRTLYLIVEHGGQKTGTGVSSEIDVRFAREDLATIKWCSYVGTDLKITGCKPAQPLKPGGEIRVK